MYFCSDFMEISNVAQFWKAYGTRNAKIYVYICVDARITAIFGFSKWPPKNTNFTISQLLDDI